MTRWALSDLAPFSRGEGPGAPAQRVRDGVQGAADEGASVRLLGRLAQAGVAEAVMDRVGRAMSIGHVEASPLTRSSYHARQAAAAIIEARPGVPVRYRSAPAAGV